MTDPLPTIVGIVVLALAAGFALLPLARGVRDPDMTESFDPAQPERFRLYRQILELEFDQQLGKVSAEDYQQLSATLLAQAGDLLRDERGPVEELDDEIEREIAAARAAFSAAKQRSSKRTASARR